MRRFPVLRQAATLGHGSLKALVFVYILFASMRSVNHLEVLGFQYGCAIDEIVRLQQYRPNAPGQTSALIRADMRERLTVGSMEG